jgi:hypothetical protein
MAVPMLFDRTTSNPGEGPACDRQPADEEVVELAAEAPQGRALAAGLEAVLAKPLAERPDHIVLQPCSGSTSSAASAS